jgi:valyl-tRNA synthetase
MAKTGRKAILPLQNREIPLILDEWAKPEIGSGCVKITPAHDPNDYAVWQRHRSEIDIINLLNLDGTYNENAGKYANLDRLKVRENVLKDLKQENLLIKTEEREIELGLSDRSKTPVEPYLSKQWFVNMGDVKDGITCGKGSTNEFHTSGLAQSAIDAVDKNRKTGSGRNLTFYPDSERYKNTFVSWLSEKRDWCISRQLWWGHRIPIWHGEIDSNQIDKIENLKRDNSKISYWISGKDGSLVRLKDTKKRKSYYTLVCLGSKETETEFSNTLEDMGLIHDPDVLDTWFSSALWPFSTLGWPDPQTAEVGKNHHPLGSEKGKDNFLQYYYPGSCLVTARDIITLWVARMTIFGLYFLGDVPFTDCFIHATIQDGKGERMSKSKGNGIDPIDIIEEFGTDAMRYVLCDMQTGSQDIKLPVQAISPFTGKPIELATARHGRTIFTYIDPDNGKEFDVLGTISSLPKAKITSKRFDLGKAFCIKLWNAARFALLNLEDYQYTPLNKQDLAIEDIWILSRLTKTIQRVDQQLKKYNTSMAIGTAREFFWSEFCDWYLEIIKQRMQKDETKNTAQTILALIIDQILRLFHPFVPYITEALWEMLNKLAVTRGLFEPIAGSDMLISADWPIAVAEWIDEKTESTFAVLQDVIRSIRDLKGQSGLSPRTRIDAVIKLSNTLEQELKNCKPHIHNLVNIDKLTMGENLNRPPLASVAIIDEIEIYLTGLIDPDKEKEKLNKQKDKLTRLLKGLEGQLNNPGFINKAPAQVINNEKQKLAELKSRIDRIEDNLKQI